MSNAMKKSLLLIVAQLVVIVVAFAAPASALTVREVKSKGGVSAYLSEDHTTPIIAITFGFKGGTAIDPDAKLGLSRMVTSLLDEGAGQLDSFAFQTALQDRAITLRFSADNDYITGQIVTTTPNRAMAAFHDRMPVVLSEENFDLWLDPNATEADLAPLLIAPPDDLLVPVRVSRAVNNVKNAGRECVAPL